MPPFRAKKDGERFGGKEGISDQDLRRDFKVIDGTATRSFSRPSAFKMPIRVTEAGS